MFAEAHNAGKNRLGLAEPASWLQYEAYDEGLSGWPLRVTQAYQPFPPGKALHALSQKDVDNYTAGFLGQPVIPNPIDGLEPFWWREGKWDKQGGRPARSMVAGAPPPAFPILLEQPPPVPAPMPTRPVYLELLAQEFGRKIPFDVAVKIQDLPSAGGLLAGIALWGLDFEFLGDAPGDDGRGYKLSGPNGPIALWVQYLTRTGRMPSADPNYYGLPAFVAAYTMGRGTTKGVRFLGREDLARVGVLDRLQALYGAPFDF